MSEPPPLPASDDPHELLGVSPESDAKELRRAYARLIKIYRPDRHPEEFRRIHAAYESALNFSRFQDLWHATDDEEEGESASDLLQTADDAAEPGADSPFTPEVTTPISEARDVLDAEGPEAALDHVRGSLENHPEDLELRAAEAALLLRLEQVTPEFVGMVADRIAARPEYLGFLEAEGAVELIDRAAGSDKLEARVLVRGSPGYLVMRALSERCQHLLLEGRWADLAREFADSSVQRAIDDEPIIASSLLRAACALAWISPADGQRLYDLAARESVPTEGSLEDRFLERARLEPAWRKWHDAHPEMAPLSRLLTLEDTVDHATFLLLLSDVGESLRADPERYLAGVADLDAADEALSVLYIGAIEPRIEEPDEEEDDTPRQQRLMGFLRDADWAIEHDFFGDVVFKLIGVLGVLAIGCFVRLGTLGRIPFIDEWGPWLGGLFLVIAALLFFFGTRFQDARLYGKHVRPRALRLALDTGITPQEIVAAMHDRQKTLESVGRFQMETAHDSPLHLVARTVTLLDGQGLR